MLKENVDKKKIEELLNLIDSDFQIEKSGIFILGSKNKKILEFINVNSNESFILDETRKLNLKDEQNDMLITKEFKFQLNSNNTIIITMSNDKFILSNEEYVKVLNNENLKLIILNEKYFDIKSGTTTIIDPHDKEIKKEINNLFNEALSDILVKSLCGSTKEYISPLSSTATTGFSTLLTNVYHGPDSNVYASVGSIGPLETVNILATSMDWYHIEYSVGSTNQRKTGYVPKSSLTNISGAALTEEDFYGGYCYASTELSVRTCDDFNRTAAVGTLFQYESCTFLFSYEFNGQNIAFIEYSSSTGTKRGYVYSQYLIFPYETIVCIANEEINVYSGPSTSHAKLGTIYGNELMGVIAKESNMIYVDYNTTSGRKRGYVDWTKVNPRDYTSGTVFRDFYRTTQASVINNGAWVSSRQDVYGGPNTNYAKTGVVNCEDIIDYNTEISPQFPLTYIEYYISGSTQKKCGYIDPTSIDTSVPMEHNTLSELETSYEHFGSRIFYGKSHLQRDMYYYQAGNGENHLFLVFAQHGWEDGKRTDNSYYHGDGNMLVRIARNFIERFCSSSFDSQKRNAILNKWTIFIFPCNNPDGIINGSTNFGFGRCVIDPNETSKTIDPNRSWAGNFISRTAYSTNNEKRNRVGSSPLGGIESQNLKNVLENKIGSGKNVLLDIHGWENDFISRNEDLAAFYLDRIKNNIDPDFRFQRVTNSSDDRGFLIAWASNPTTQSELDNFPNVKAGTINEVGLGADTGLLEFPKTTNYEPSHIEEKCGLQFFEGTIDLLLNY